MVVILQIVQVLQQSQLWLTLGMLQANIQYKIYL